MGIAVSLRPSFRQKSENSENVVSASALTDTRLSTCRSWLHLARQVDARGALAPGSQASPFRAPHSAILRHCRMVLCLLDGENDRQVYKLRDLVGAAASSSSHERISLRKGVMLPVRYGMTRDGLMASLWRQLLIALAKGLSAPLCSVGSQDFVGRRPEENMVQKSGS